MWAAAESRLAEHPDKVWVLAVDPTGRPLAWCAYEPADEDGAEVKAVDSYERPDSWDEDWYAVVYAARHELIRHHPAVTYIFDEPMDLHLADGWRPFREGWSNEPGVESHHWTGLRLTPPTHERQPPMPEPKTIMVAIYAIDPAQISRDPYGVPCADGHSLRYELHLATPTDDGKWLLETWLPPGDDRQTMGLAPNLDTLAARITEGLHNVAGRGPHERLD